MHSYFSEATGAFVRRFVFRYVEGCMSLCHNIYNDFSFSLCNLDTIFILLGCQFLFEFVTIFMWVWYLILTALLKLTQVCHQNYLDLLDVDLLEVEYEFVKQTHVDLSVVYKVIRGNSETEGTICVWQYFINLFYIAENILS